MTELVRSRLQEVDAAERAEGPGKEILFVSTTIEKNILTHIVINAIMLLDNMYYGL